MKVQPKEGSGFKSMLKLGAFGVKVAIGVEVASLIGSYFLWRKMNNDQDFRHKVYKVSPYILNYYYKVGEKLGGSSFRNEDEEAWGIQSIKSSS